MGRGAEVCLLRDDGMDAKMHFARVVDNRIICDGRPVVAAQIPGSPDPALRINVAVPADTCPEQAEQPAAPGVKRTRGGPEQQHIRHSPERPTESIQQRRLRQQVRVLNGGVQPMGAGGQFEPTIL